MAIVSSACSSCAKVRSEGHLLTVPPSSFDECCEFTRVTEDDVRGVNLSDLGVSPEVVRGLERYSCMAIGGASFRITAAS